ncbi:hypothetical protein [Pseudohalocynthiibacter sp. F2068]|uniref:hypothetical protein n=1 Tax=Pseudohalocynthiibacter sp. F2068 TaxID=2926418 RepID=UPI001FF29DA2|nr:hypothetical protein [Pseudohalocynthiibacter sp. F2068]MCK0102537.1 hypothetical protein [Pseudohalocynthiibacter sp. F2068]
MTQLNSNIILQGRQPDIVNALSKGTLAAAQTNTVQRQNALADLYQTQGPGIASGNQNALNALATLDPQQALGVQQTRLGMDATRQGMDVLSAQEQRAIQQHAATMSAAERATEAKEIEQAVSMGMQLQTSEQWDAMMRQFDEPTLIGQFENREVIASRYLSIADSLNRFDEQNAPTDPSDQYRTVGGNLVDLNAEGGPQAVDFGGQPNTTARDAQVQMLMETGLDEITAKGIASGRLAISRDPVTGQAQVIDKGTGRPFTQGTQAPEETLTPEQTGTMPTGTDFDQATGGRGFVASLANTVSDALGGGLIDPNNERATQAMQNLATQTMITLADGVAGRPSNYLLEQFEKLTTTPNSIWQGSGRTRERLNQTRAMIYQAILMNQDVVQSAVTPKMRAEATQNMTRLSRLLTDYDAVIESFGTRGNEGGNQTSGGVSWRVVE